MRARYFDSPFDTEGSLLRLGASLGFDVIALDRPGYGSSSSALADGLQLEEAAPFMWAAVDAAKPRGRVFVAGHSAGMKLALAMAAYGGDERGLLGVDCNGAGLSWRQHAADEQLTPRDLYWGPAALYPNGTMERTREVTARVTTADKFEAGRWTSSMFAAVAERVHVPVRFVVADHESFWDTSDDVLTKTRALFRASPRLSIETQVDAGHNISLGRSARAHHLKLLAFAQECLL